MANQLLEMEYNEHKLKAITKILKSEEKLISALTSILDRFFDEKVSESEKQRVDEIIAAEKEKDELNSNSFSIIHLHDKNEDIFFTSRNTNTLYDLMNLFKEGGIGFMAKHNYTVDSIMLCFDDYSCISEEVYKALSSALVDNEKISLEAHFEFDVNTLEYRDKKHPDMYGFDLTELENIYERIHDDIKTEFENETLFDECINELYASYDEGFNIGM